ncbi:hypothetical protein TA3x_002253 [Tundrisphaera sp. TA3]|uniref:hypothetical protein n=1 Tax=Tundrisphaera sp. TA3 TaxID=3435775 RepID=UPI003EBAF977
MNLRSALLMAPLLSGLALAAGPGQTWDFEADAPGALPKNFTNEVGRWVVAQDGGNRALLQDAKNEKPAFNVALVDAPPRKDLDLSVRLRAIDGEIDQGGGLVWRARDARNYYTARYNPLEDNLRIYKVQDGVRTMFGSADVPGDLGWHTLRVTMVGPKMTCSLDGKKFLEAEDATFPDAGRIGLWTKADARTQFDDLTLAD